MPDQAEKLRQMIAGDAPANVDADSGPLMVVVSGGKGGVGTTTIAMNLAAALANGGHRIVLVDAARHHADLTQLAGIHICGGSTLTEVLAGRISALDALAPGPAGTLLLADHWASKSRADYSRAAQHRLLAELRALQAAADILIIDTGSGLSQWTRRFWKHAALVIVPTTCDDVAVMDTYATIKLGASECAEAEFRILLNRCDSNFCARDVERRLTMACRRFLGRTISALPTLPSQINTGIDGSDILPPRVWEIPDTPFGHAALWLGRAVGDIIERRASILQSPAGA